MRNTVLLHTVCGGMGEQPWTGPFEQRRRPWYRSSKPTQGGDHAYNVSDVSHTLYASRTNLETTDNQTWVVRFRNSPFVSRTQVMCTFSACLSVKTDGVRPLSGACDMFRLCWWLLRLDTLSFCALRVFPSCFLLGGIAEAPSRPPRLSASDVTPSTDVLPII